MSIETADKQSADDIKKEDPANATSFIEVQFPVAKVSMESYKERKSAASQTLTSLGKWWGRKPLIVVRTTILGSLMPATDTPETDREIFLKILTMDDAGLSQRKCKAIPAKEVLPHLLKLPASIQARFLDESKEKPALKRLSNKERKELQGLVFERMPYSEKLKYVLRPEHAEGPTKEAWKEINSHLNTSADSLDELINELGDRRFGRRPVVGDGFSGAGSIPFEAARIGCDAVGTDLNPVATLLTWAAFNIVGGGDVTANAANEAQRRVYESAREQIEEWGIETSDDGWQAEAYLYCAEVIDPETGFSVPLSPSCLLYTSPSPRD